jgi:hypothetical protein
MPRQVLHIAAGIALALCAGQIVKARALHGATPLQDSATPSPQDSVAQPKSGSAGAAVEQKKPKKVWTNENLGDAHGTVSQIGEAKALEKAKPAAAKPYNATFVANYRRQLAALDAQIADADKQIADLKNFGKGEASKGNGLELHKHYTMESTDAQIHNLEEKKKQLHSQIDAILDAARKKGIEPGQLR